MMNLSICIILNGIGDVFLSLPLIRKLNQDFKDNFLLITNAESLCFFEDIDYVLGINDTTTEFQLSEITTLNQMWSLTNANITLISLNFYSPLSVYEKTLTDKLKPKFKFDYEDYKRLNNSETFNELPMFIKYFKVCNYEYEYQERKLNNSFYNKSKVRICFHIDTDKSKEWEYDNWFKIIRYISEYNRFEIVLLGQPQLSRKINRNLIIPADFRENLNYLTNCDYFLGIDSCFAHIADAHCIKGFVLFGPVNINEWKPYSGTLDTIIAPNGDMRNISFSNVWNKIQKMIEI
jgi:ADP-heptose:LPS heptosyltransferase